MSDNIITFVLPKGIDRDVTNITEVTVPRGSGSCLIHSSGEILLGIFHDGFLISGRGVLIFALEGHTLTLLVRLNKKVKLVVLATGVRI